MLLKEIKNPIFALNYFDYEKIFRVFGTFVNVERL